MKIYVCDRCKRKQDSKLYILNSSEMSIRVKIDDDRFPEVCLKCYGEIIDEILKDRQKE